MSLKQLHSNWEDQRLHAGSSGTKPEDLPAKKAILNPPIPSKTQRVKKSDTKKPKQVNPPKSTSNPPKIKDCGWFNPLCEINNLLAAITGKPQINLEEALRVAPKAV